ncbi:MAG: DEAD/DEAH box helicase family protein [Candidatus Accumulibacter sp.]|uniref:DEAD/DEAH box helicase n=1 Tax=Accumulibacter sp. TaxID=2053492 RepID=UPI0025877D16|nr:DEAD/DEAH box helicase family protein [Accumulibacter sp.]MBK8116234.1 DEAD/DEAH box helicase family protein [Accumulibacter sp.]
MSAPAPKGYQREAVVNALEIFRYAESQLRQAGDDASRAAATAFNGCLLLEAPTGSGKTLMAGMIAESFAAPDRDSNARIVWFWFTPFAGLVEQAKGAIKSTFVGLRVRDLQGDRKTRGSKSGDVFVTTWASVAATNKETRKIRSSGEFVLALDDLIAELRAEGFRIGVVVDEAHHGFTRAAEAVRFYRETMRPDFTLMITATPDDQDVDKFKKAAGIEHLHRVRVSRKEAVDAGLIKDGIKSIAYLAADDQKAMVDFPATALADGWDMHGAIKHGLQAAGIGLVPLMLVQVGNSNAAVEEARTRLAALGVPDSKIAWYTADDPNDDLLAVAIDEQKEVLIFKVAVALGFDAPRAFTLVSMRGAKDTDFGMQVVGRILRVHGRLQGPTLEQSLPELLRHGYVFLADAANQSGLVHAGEKINAIQSALSQVCPFTMVVKVAGRNEIQVTHNGQAQLLSLPYTPPAWAVPVTDSGNAGSQVAAPPAWQPTGILTHLVLTPPEAAPPTPHAPRTSPLLAGNRRFPIRQGVPRVHRAERLPLSTGDLLTCIAASIAIDHQVFQAGLRQSVKVTRRIVDVFEGSEEMQSLQARLSDEEIARRAQGVMFDADYVDPRDLHDALLARLKSEFGHRGIDVDDAGLERALNRIMAAYPHLIRVAARSCAARFKEVFDTAPLPEFVELPRAVQRSRRNVYGVMPQDLNGSERAFADLLDADTTGMVDYWFRNEPRKPWSIGIVMPSGDRYFPDFAVKVAGHAPGHDLLLVETKGRHILNGDDTLDKILAEHKVYGVPLMLAQDDCGRFMTVKFFASTGRNEEDQIFRLENLAGYCRAAFI